MTATTPLPLHRPAPAVPSGTWTVVLAVAGVAGLARMLFARLEHLPLVFGAAVVVLPVLAVYGGVIGLVIRRLDRWRTLRRRPALTALAWGALVATPLALAGNGHLSTVLHGLLGADGAAQWTPPLVAPVVEETVKALGVLAAFLVAGRTAGPLEAMMLGALSGLGFQMTENVVYVYDGMLFDPNSDLAGGLQTLLLARMPAGLAGHWCYTAFTGLAIGLLLARTRRHLAGAVAAASVAVGAHFLNNVAGTVLGTAFGPFATLLVAWVVAPVVVFTALAVALRFAGREQYRRAAGVLAGEPAAVCTEDERIDLRTRRTARTARRATRRGHGRAAARARGRLQAAQVRLVSAVEHGEPSVDARRAVVEQRPTVPGRDGARPTPAVA